MEMPVFTQLELANLPEGEAGSDTVKLLRSRSKSQRTASHSGDPPHAADAFTDEPKPVGHRVLIVPPQTTDTSVKALLHAWCSHETVTGYVLLLSSDLPNLTASAWNAIDELPVSLSLRDQRLLYDLRIVPNCVSLLAGSLGRLKRARQEFE